MNTVLQSIYVTECLSAKSHHINRSMKPAMLHIQYLERDYCRGQIAMTFAEHIHISQKTLLNLVIL